MPIHTSIPPPPWTFLFPLSPLFLRFLLVADSATAAPRLELHELDGLSSFCVVRSFRRSLLAWLRTVAEIANAIRPRGARWRFCDSGVVGRREGRTEGATGEWIKSGLDWRLAGWSSVTRRVVHLPTGHRGSRTSHPECDVSVRWILHETSQ